MKRQRRSEAIGILAIGLALACLAGCVQKEAFWDPEEQKVITPEQYQQLPPEQQVLYEQVVTTEIEPATRAKVDAAMDTAKESHDLLSPYLPEPIRTPLALIVGLAAALWQSIRRKRISLGARITAENLKQTVRKEAPEAWEKFKAAQSAASANSKAIMPDKA